jgi:1,4-dihydroxy-2-naphthoate octaprenyltransferase
MSTGIDDRKRPSKVLAWLKIARLQFYPMAWIAYSLGAACATKHLGDFHFKPYLAGYLCLFLIELCTVLVNEYFDYETDKLNQNASIFTGGSRVLVNRLLSLREVRLGLTTVALLLIMSTILLVRCTPDLRASSVCWVVLLGTVLGVGYTAPPIKFCYRTLGELVVAFTHSTYVLLCGFFFQGGALNSPEPWLMSLPLCFAVLPAIILSGLPDYSADTSVLKKTIVVLFGPRRGTIIAMVCAVLAVIFSAILTVTGVLTASGIALLAIAAPHALILLKVLIHVYNQELFDCRIDNVMRLALVYILWFGLVPLAGLLWR